MNAILQNYKVKIVNIKNEEPSIVNSYVDRIYVINLLEDSLKRNYIITLFQKLKIDFSLIVVERLSKEDYKFVQKHSQISISEAGCLFSHIWCLKNMIDNKLKNCIIFEDDIILHKHFEELLIGHLERNPDFLMLGACDFNFRKQNHRNVSNYIYFPVTFEYLFGAHANYYSLEGAKRMFDIKTSCVSFFDNFLAEQFCFFPDSSGVCYPNLAVTDITKSALNHSYSLLSNYESYFYNKCFVAFDFQDYNFIYIHLLNEVMTAENANKFQSYNNFIKVALHNYFHNEENANKIYKRLSFDFFTLDDVKNILHKI
jgi:GR25 family glycosyltransferase involved in LPS biosynthesis